MSDLFNPEPVFSHLSSKDINNLGNTDDLVASSQPLADLLRPKQMEDVMGQDHLLADAGALARMLKNKHLPSLILWGPPGCGKTTIARLISNHSNQHFEQISAIFAGVSEMRQIFEQARIRRKNGIGTILFVDEIHRFSKSQQDAFLPVVENGTITLIGATTENPSFELNSALLSRMQVLVLKRLDDSALEKILQRAENFLGYKIPLTDTARDLLRTISDGDGRYILSLVHQVLLSHSTHGTSSGDERSALDEKKLLQLIQRRAPLYDKAEDSHYNLISALHKSVRGSDVQAALYWFSRMLEGGEDPHFIARRMVRMAVEDIGLADPQALILSMNAWQAYERLGSPEGELALCEALVYLSTAPKSNASYKAYKAARSFASQHGSLMPPKHILNAPTKLMKNQGYGKNYMYDHDAEDAFSGQSYFPDELERKEFYHPFERGFEREIIKRLEYWNKLRQRRLNNAPGPERDNISEL